MKNIKAWLLVVGFFCLINNAYTMEEQTADVFWSELQALNAVELSESHCVPDGKKKKRRRKRKKKKCKKTGCQNTKQQDKSKTQDTSPFRLIREKKLAEFKTLFTYESIYINGYTTPVEKLLYIRSSRNKDTFLHVAVHLGLIDFVNVILEAIKGQPCIDKLSQCAFYKIRIGARAIVKRMKPLVNNGCWINGIANKDGQTPYGLARTLLKEIKNEPLSNDAVAKSLQELRLQNLESIIKAFQTHEIQMFGNCSNSKEQRTPPIPLFGASYQRNGDVLGFLLKNGADLNVCGDDGKTVLGYLCTRESGSCFGKVYERLIQEGIDYNMTDCDGNTSIMLAVKYEDYCLCELLVVKDDLVIDQYNNKGENIFHIMANMTLDRKGGKEHNLNHPEVLVKNLTRLLKKVTQSNKDVLIKKDFNGNTPLHYAVKNGLSVFSEFFQKIQELFPEAIDLYLSLQDDCGFSVLHRAIAAGLPSMVAKCLASGASTEPTDDGQSCASLLKVAIDDDPGKTESCLQILRMLDIHCKMEKDNLNVNDPIDDYDNTFLHLAAKDNQIYVIGMLLLMDADIHQVNSAGSRPQDCAPNGSLSAQLLDESIGEITYYLKTLHV